MTPGQGAREWRRCIIPHCPAHTRIGRLCADHYEAVPEDLRERLHWAIEERDRTEIDAALRACVEAVTP